MIIPNKHLTPPASALVSAFVLGLGVAALASPGIAENRNNSARDAAIHECSVKASKWSFRWWAQLEGLLLQPE
jgi:hypothetical protein